MHILTNSCVDCAIKTERAVLEKRRRGLKKKEEGCIRTLTHFLCSSLVVVCQWMMSHPKRLLLWLQHTKPRARRAVIRWHTYYASIMP
jgi:hypothetical protein